MRTLIALALLAAGCAGDSGDPGTPLCLKELYDACVTEHDCANEVCFTFDDGLQACSQACSAEVPCPDTFDGKPVACDAIGLCKPAAPTECVPPDPE